MVRIDGHHPVGVLKGPIRLAVRGVESRRHEQRPWCRRRTLNEISCTGLGIGHATKANEAPHDLRKPVPVVWLLFEHFLGLGDCLLVALKTQQDVGPEAVIVSVFIEGDCLVECGESLAKLILHEVRLRKIQHQITVRRMFFQGFPAGRYRCPAFAGL